jgi:thiol-disulfide isomerase/thioredoxin
MDLRNNLSNQSRRERIAVFRKQQRDRNRWLIVVGILILSSIIYLTLSNKSPNQMVVPAQIGSVLSDFTLNNLKGEAVHITDFKDKPVLINAWATWCPPCRAEMPLLSQYYLVHRQQDLVLLAVNAGDPESDVTAFAKQYDLPFIVLLDPSAQLLAKLGIGSYPTSILVGRDGKVKAIHFGEFTQNTLDTEITPLLSQ